MGTNKQQPQQPLNKPQAGGGGWSGGTAGKPGQQQNPNIKTPQQPGTKPGMGQQTGRPGLPKDKQQDERHR